MPLGKNIRFRYRDLPKKNGHRRRQRLAFDTKGTPTRRDDRVVEVRTETQRKGNWFGTTSEVRGNGIKRGSTRRSL